MVFYYGTIATVRLANALLFLFLRKRDWTIGGEETACEGTMAAFCGLRRCGFYTQVCGDFDNEAKRLLLLFSYAIKIMKTTARLPAFRAISEQRLTVLNATPRGALLPASVHFAVRFATAYPGPDLQRNGRRDGQP